MTFKDKENREWLVKINYAAVERVVDETGFNLLKLADPSHAADLDGVKLLRILFSLVKPQADSLKVDYEHFRDALDADAVEAAERAIMEGLISFSPSRLRPVMAKMHSKRQALQAAALTKLDKALDETSVEDLLTQMDKAIAVQLTSGSTGAVTNVPASAESATSEI